MRYCLKALSLSVLMLLLMGGMCQHKKETPILTSGICAYLKENLVHAKATDDLETKRKSAAQIKYYNDKC